MKKNFTSTAVLLLLTSITYAQNSSYGFHAGTSIGKIEGKQDNRSYTFRNLINVQAGFLAEFKASKNISFQSGVNYVQKGGTLEEDFFGTDIEASIRLHTIEIPVYALYRTGGNKGNFFIGAGPAVSFSIAGNTVMKNNGEEESEKMEIGNDEENDNIRAIDFGINVLAGYQFKSGVFIGATHNFGLRNMVPGNDPEMGTAITSYYGFRIGYMFGKR
ncbi:porin family protein [Lacibacter sp. H407]|uniref:porin family protein n=1 Tax=Lacibacter sp. H407 TaxID=3133423 RepID=UPI0030BB1A3A